MKKHNIKPAIALALMIAGFASIATAVTINAVTIIGKVGWFGAAQLSDFGSMVAIYKESPAILFTSIAFFIGGYALIKSGAHIAQR